VDDRDLVGDPDHPRIVGVLDANQDILGLEPRQTTEDLLQQTLGQLGAAAAVGRALGQLDDVV